MFMRAGAYTLKVKHNHNAFTKMFITLKVTPYDSAKCLFQPEVESILMELQKHEKYMWMYLHSRYQALP